MLVSDINQVCLLRDVPPLAGRTDRELARLAAVMDEVRLEAGSTLAPATRQGLRLCIVVEGEARVCRRDGSGVAGLGPGQFLVESAGADGRQASRLEAVTPLRLLLLQPGARSRRAAAKSPSRRRPCPRHPQSSRYPDATGRQAAS